MPQGPNGVKNPLPPADKQAWRRWARARRAELDVGAASAALVAPLRSWLDAQPPTTVLAYRAMPAELSLDAVVAADRRHRWATTRTPTTGPLTLHPWHSPLEEHRLGYLQPVAEAESVPAESIGVVLAPGLVFDRQGNRLGYGKGYYDGLLAGLDAVAVGVTVEDLIVERLAVDEHDVAMAWLVDARGVHRCPLRL